MEYWEIFPKFLRFFIAFIRHTVSVAAQFCILEEIGEGDTHMWEGDVQLTEMKYVHTTTNTTDYYHYYNHYFLLRLLWKLIVVKFQGILRGKVELNKKKPMWMHAVKMANQQYPTNDLES